MLIINAYIGSGGGFALAAQPSSTDIVSLSAGGAVDSGLNGGGGQESFTKTGNEILSSYPFIYSSDDGESFSSVTTNLSSASSYNDVATDGTYWLALATISGQGYFSVSTNRTTWTAYAPTNINDAYSFATGDGKYVISGYDGGGHDIWYSSNRSAWTQVNASGTVGSSVFQNTDIAYGNGYFIIVGDEYVARAASSSLSSWTAYATSVVGSSGSNQMPKIAYSSALARWVIVNSDPTGVADMQAQYSNNDGATWISATIPTLSASLSRINAVVALNGGGFIATGVNDDATGAALYSADGITWVNITGASSFQGLYGLVAK